LGDARLDSSVCRVLPSQGADSQRCIVDIVPDKSRIRIHQQHQVHSSAREAYGICGAWSVDIVVIDNARIDICDGTWRHFSKQPRIGLFFSLFFL